jgi:hypothetical protein
MLAKQLMKSLLILLMSLIGHDLFANPPLATKQQIGMFKNSTTCIVMDNGVSFYNNPIKEAVKKFWKATPYEIIDQDEFNKRKTDSRFSFLVVMDGAYDKDPGGVSYNYMSLILGDPSGNLTKMPEFCSVPISYSGDNEADYEYVIPLIVKFMQIHVRNLEKDRLPISLNGLRYYNKTGFTGKLLLLNKEKMGSAVDSPEKIKAVCNYKVKLLSTADIQEELKAGTANTLFHFHVGPAPEGAVGRSFDMLFDADGNLYYYNFRKITNDNPDGFNTNDFNNIR